MIPGEIISSHEFIELNSGADVTVISVANLGDRPIQVGSHFHFFEVNKLLSFTRRPAYGRRLNIPSGTAVRFEPGEVKKIELIPFRGRQTVIGFNGLVNGVANRENLVSACAKITEQQFANEDISR